jgi:excisionase family DNA binding protein
MALPKEWYNLDEAAAYMGVSKRTLYKWTKEGRLRAYRLGKSRIRRFRKEDLDNIPELIEDGVENRELAAVVTLSAVGDPVLAELWNNEKDAVYKDS